MNLKLILYGLFSSIIYFLVFGAISAVFSNPFFIRMTPVILFDWFLLVITSILIGLYVFLYFSLRDNNSSGIRCATTGGVLSFLAFACPVCNKIIVLILGFSGAMTYFYPIQPFLGVLGIILLVYINIIYIKKLKNGKRNN